MAETNAAFDAIYAELLATRALTLQVFAFLGLANAANPNWLDEQRFMLHQEINSIRLDGHPNAEAIKAMARAAVDRLLEEVRRSRVVSGAKQ